MTMIITVGFNQEISACGRCCWSYPSAAQQAIPLNTFPADAPATSTLTVVARYLNKKEDMHQKSQKETHAIHLIHSEGDSILARQSSPQSLLIPKTSIHHKPHKPLAVTPETFSSGDWPMHEAPPTLRNWWRPQCPSGRTWPAAFTPEL